QSFGTDATEDALEVRPNRHIARRDWAEVDVAALAGDRDPQAAGVDQGAGAKTGSWANHQPGPVGLGTASADLVEVARRQTRERERQRLEIVKEDDFI